MSVLTKKLLRTIRHTRGPFLAVVAVVMAGISLYVAMATSYYNLSRSQTDFYRTYFFADYYFHVVKAPEQVVKQIAAIPGVAKATGRLQKDLPLLKENNRRATVRLISYPLPMSGEVNQLQVLTGRLFNQYSPGGRMEILTDPQFARVNHLSVNDTVKIIAAGRVVPLTVVGTATGPELIYPMPDAASLVTDPQTFGIIMLSHHLAQQILNLPGQINQVVIKLAPGADEKKVRQQVERILQPYGNLAAYPRQQQLSHAVLQSKLDGLRASSRFLPIIFLGIAAAIQFIVLGRLIKSQRTQIGVMKALGYRNGQIIAHYTAYALAVAFAGALLGCLLGVLLASVISQTFAEYFNLPAALSGVNLQAILYGFWLSLATGGLAGITASQGISKIQPATAMRPAPPKKGGPILLEKWQWFWRQLDACRKMSWRTTLRHRGRFVFTLAGVMLAVGMLVAALFTRDAVDFMLREHFQQQQRYDYLLRFSNPVKENELLAIRRLAGVQKVEPLLELPVRLHYQGKAEEDLLVGLPAGVTLKKLTDAAGQPLHLPPSGLLVHARTAQKLGLQPGHWVTVETLAEKGISRKATVKVAGIHHQIIGRASYIRLPQANQLLGESHLVSGAMLLVDPGLSAELANQLDRLTGVAFILSKQKELAYFKQNLDSLLYTVSLMVLFASLLGFAIVYNTAVVNLNDRKRELASLRVLGFTAREVAGLLRRDTMLQSLPGVLLGLPFGYFMAQGYVQAVSSDLFTLPAVIYPATYLYAALGGILFVAAAHLLAVRQLRQLDLAEVLKNKD